MSVDYIVFFEDSSDQGGKKQMSHMEIGLTRISKDVCIMGTWGLGRCLSCTASRARQEFKVQEVLFFASPLPTWHISLVPVRPRVPDFRDPGFCKEQFFSARNLSCGRKEVRRFGLIL